MRKRWAAPKFPRPPLGAWRSPGWGRSQANAALPLCLTPGGGDDAVISWGCPEGTMEASRFTAMQRSGHAGEAADQGRPPAQCQQTAHCQSSTVGVPVGFLASSPVGRCGLSASDTTSVWRHVRRSPLRQPDMRVAFRAEQECLAGNLALSRQTPKRHWSTK